MIYQFSLFGSIMSENQSTISSSTSSDRAVVKETQFCIGFKDEPGKLAVLCATLREAKINVEALFVSEDEDTCWVNFIGLPAKDTAEALRDASYDFYTEEVLVVRVSKGPAELEQLASRLAEAKININYVYGSCCLDTPSTLVLHVSDLDKAAELLSDIAS